MDVTSTALASIRDSVEVLPLPLDDTGRRWHLRSATTAWLLSFESKQTRRAYFKDLAAYLAWCETTGLDARQATRADIDAWRATLTGALATISRKLSTVSSWYAYLVEMDLSPRNPVGAIRRPKVDRGHSPTVGLSKQEAIALLVTADADSPRSGALMRLMVGLGIRVNEACRAEIADLGHEGVHRTLTVYGKGGKIRRRPLPPQVGAAVDRYLADRAAAAGVEVDDLAGPLFVSRTGNRLDQPTVFRLLRRLARAAEIASWGEISPHSLRHAWNTIAREAGADLDARQDALAHADPRTTRRYDRAAHRLDTDPAYLVAAATAAP